MPIRVVVEVSDGEVIGIRSNTPDVQVLIADYDVLDVGSHIIEGQEFTKMDVESILDTAGTDAFFNAKEM